VTRELILPIDVERDEGLEAFVVEPHVRHPPDDHPRALDRRPDLQPANVSKLGLHLICLGGREGGQIAHLEAKKQQPAKPRSDEDADPQVDAGAFHFALPPVNMSAVSMKSSARMASDEVTTVRVVAPDTPSAVGGASYPSNTAIQVTATPNTRLLITPLRMSL